jgi:DNA-binding MarR family transcriptional regulator
VKRPIDIEASLPFQIIRLANLFGTNFYKSAPKIERELSLTEWRIMMTLAFHPGISAIEVCRHTGYSEVNVSRALKNMLKRGLVLRGRDPDDRRRTQLKLAAAGLRTYNRLRPMAESSISGLSRSISPSREENLRHSISTLIEVMSGVIDKNK